MEQYKEKLKLQNGILAVSCVILACFTVLGFIAEAGIIELTPTTGDSHWQSTWRGFLSGAAMGVLGLMLFGLIQNLRAMKDEKKLKKLYIKCNDERSEMIYVYARNSAMQVFLTLGLVAVIVAGYFSIAVSVTILACVFFSSILSIGFKVYYSKRY
nr:hypothetical protein [Oscillospiraceae bacterium]